MAGERHIDTPCRESLGMGGLFSAYWEGMGKERGREGGTETEREEEWGGQRQRLPFQKREQRERKEELMETCLPWWEGGDWEWAELVS